MDTRMCRLRVGEETFIVFFDPTESWRTVQAMRSWAANPELGFSCCDAFNMLATIACFAPRPPASDPPPAPIVQDPQA